MKDEASHRDDIRECWNMAILKTKQPADKNQLKKGK
jgi:hypothetical protein